MDLPVLVGGLVCLAVSLPRRLWSRGWSAIVKEMTNFRFSLLLLGVVLVVVSFF